MGRISLEELHEILFAILSRFADYCDAHKVRYYLCGGTLLGAVRHKDFIPWDDDVDVLVPRPDYERLNSLLREEPIEGFYEYMDSERMPEYYLPYMRIMDLRTSTGRTGHNSQVWIDVFPMDGLPRKRFVCATFLQLAWFLKRLNGFSRTELGTGSTPLKTVGKIPVVLFARAFGPAYWLRKQTKLALKYDFDRSEYVGAVASSMGSCERMKKADYLPQVEVQFHGRAFHAPACWETYLVSLYGKHYMRIPPKKKRIQKHFTAAKWITSEPTADKKRSSEIKCSQEDSFT